MTPAEQLADAILTASGSGLKHYTSESARAPILAAAQREIDKRTALRTKLIAMCEMGMSIIEGETGPRGPEYELFVAAIQFAKGERT